MTTTEVDGMSLDPALFLGPVFLGVLLNAYFVGVVGQQFYTYWTSGFRDSKYTRCFVVTQFAIVIFQSVIIMQTAWDTFIDNYGLSISSCAWSWRWPVSSLCQCSLILLANAFLAVRIYALTKSRLQCGLVVALSSSAFILGIATNIMTWRQALRTYPAVTVTRVITSSQNATSIAWHVLQAISEVLITILLAWVLLKSRSGHQTTDSVVNRIVRSVVQIGILGTLSALVGLTTWFFLQSAPIYVIFDMTVGSIYTNAIYETLLSRVQLRERLASNGHVDSTVSTQLHPSDILERQRASPETKVPDGLISVISMGSLTLATSEIPGRGFLEKDDVESNVCPVG